MKTKAPTVSGNLNFAGKIPGSHQRETASGTFLQTGACRKRTAPGDRGALSGDDFGIIVRTNAAGISEEDLRQELKELTETYRRTVETGRNQTCFSLVYREPSAYTARLRGLRTDSFDKILTDRPEIYEELRDYLTLHQPEDLPKLELYEKTAPSLDSVLWALQSPGGRPEGAGMAQIRRLSGYPAYGGSDRHRREHRQIHRQREKIGHLFENQSGGRQGSSPPAASPESVRYYRSGLYRHGSGGRAPGHYCLCLPPN